MSTVMYINAEHLHNLACSTQSVRQILDNLRVGKINIVRSHNQDTNQGKAAFTKIIQTENTGKDITNVFFKLYKFKNPFKNFKFVIPPSILRPPQLCPKNMVWKINKCIHFYFED